jgi:hypothetical protein
MKTWEKYLMFSVLFGIQSNVIEGDSIPQIIGIAAYAVLGFVYAAGAVILAFRSNTREEGTPK